MEAAREVDWVAKLKVLRATSTATASSGRGPPAKAVDIRGAGRGRDKKGFFHRLRAAGCFEELVTDDEALHAVHEPPTDTAPTRHVPGEVPRPDRGRLVGLGDLRRPRALLLQRVPMLEPLRHEGGVGRHCSTRVWTLPPFFASWHRHRARVALGSSPGTHKRRSRDAKPEQSRPQRREDAPDEAPEPTPRRPTPARARRTSTATSTASSTRSTACSSPTRRSSCAVRPEGRPVISDPTQGACRRPSWPPAPRPSPSSSARTPQLLPSRRPSRRVAPSRHRTAPPSRR